MNKKIRIVDNNKDNIIITWDIINTKCEYNVVGLNNLHNYETITKTKDNKATISKEKLKDFIEIKVHYITKSIKEIIIDTTEAIKINELKLDIINVKIIDSYEGITLSYANDTIYDKYYIYEKNNDIYNLILETEDFQITSNIFKKTKYYYIEGLKKENDNYILKAKSNEFLCKPQKLEFTKKIDLSIVIPVYNAEIFLSRCIDSILLSTFNSYEIILVDDGSTDNSHKIINWYKNKYEDIIKIIPQENQGVSYARNKGIDNATGEYIAFVDNDDLVHPNMYEKLYNVAKENNLDIAIGKTIIRKDKNEYNYCLDIPDMEDDYLIYDYDKMMKEKNLSSYKNIFFVAIWNKIIRTKLVREHKFPLHNYYEDTAFTKNIYSYIDKFAFVKDAIYVWDKRFQKTIGTASNRYSNNDSNYIHNAYIYSVFYVAYEGNKERKEIIIYDCIKEAIDFMKNIKNDNTVLNMYIDKINEFNKDNTLLDNTYIKKDQNVYEYLKNLLNK